LDDLGKQLLGLGEEAGESVKAPAYQALGS
jgi:hypothetical protein